MVEISMMNYNDFITIFKKQVFSIGYDRQLALAIDVCKKLYFDYVDFWEKYQWGEKEVLLDAIILLEQSKSEDISQMVIDRILSLINTITPDIDEFGDELASYALNACVAVYNSVQFISDKQPEHIFDIGISLTDTIDIRIQEQQILNEQEIDMNPLMINARNYLLEKSK